MTISLLVIVESLAAAPPAKANPIYHENKCLDALYRVQDTLQLLGDSNVPSYGHLSNVPSTLDALIDAFESSENLPNDPSRDTLDDLIPQTIEYLKNKNITLAPRLDETASRKLNDQISQACDLLQKLNTPEPSSHEQTASFADQPDDASGNRIPSVK